MVGGGGRGGLSTLLAGGPVPAAFGLPLPALAPLLCPGPWLDPTARALILGLCVAAENTDEAGVPAGDEDLEDEEDGDRSKNDVVDDSRSLDGTLDLEPATGGP